MASSESPGVTIQPAWNDPSLAVKSDTAWRAQYRWLQSWYRETVLRTPRELILAGSRAQTCCPPTPWPRTQG